MTAQLKERIIINGNLERMFEEPDIPEIPSIEFSDNKNRRSSCWRGYLGTWMIMNDKLYLLNIAPYGNIQAVKYIKEEPLFADWYSGEISIIEDGQENLYFPNDFKMIFTIANGSVIKTTLNSKPICFGDGFWLNKQ